MPGDNRGTHHLVPALADVNLDEAGDLPVQLGSVDVSELLDEGLRAIPRSRASRSLSLTWPISGSVYVYRYGQRAHPVPAKEEGVTNDDSRCRVGNVSEFEARSDVSRSKDPAVGRAHLVVDCDSARLVIVDAGTF